MYFSRFKFCIWNIVLVGNVFSHPDKYQFQDAETNKTFDLLQIFDYGKSGGEQNNQPTVEPVDDWTGRWLPPRPNEPTIPPKVLPSKKDNKAITPPEVVPSEKDHETHDNRIPMGIKRPSCDDGMTNLTVDWDYSLSSITCYGQKIQPNHELPATLHCKTIPKNYVAMHVCMHHPIEYDDDIPLYGPHRPIWPVYGEYRHVPKQRWVHSLEHGAIVMLYHPCANQLEVDALKNLVKGCLRRHIITPYNELDEERPLALLSWGCILSMSTVNKDAVVKFIQENALNAPERYLHQDGGFADQLLSKAEIVTDLKDSILCPSPN